MIRFEASLDGVPVIGEPFTNFNELSELKNIFDSLSWQYEIITVGRGGYFFFKIIFADGFIAKIHVYLKRITFGGREMRPYEKRAQFSAALDRSGFLINESKEEFCLILGIYKSDKYDNPILCAWNIHDWGHNMGRAFNCFVDVRAISKALVSGFEQHKTSIGQIVCCFTPEKFAFYLQNKIELHNSINEEILKSDFSLKDSYSDEIPTFPSLFQLIIDILKEYNGITNIDTIEIDAGQKLKLTETAKIKIHNAEEGNRTELGYQLAWARYYLKRANLINSPRRTIWELTKLGWDTTEVNRELIIKAATEAEIKNEFDNDTLLFTESENDIEKENDFETTLIENPFDPNLVDIRTKTMSLDLIIRRLRHDAIDMATSFQRKANLWNITKQSRLIESILVKFPLPAFYFDGSNDDKWLVVDGLQRLSSLDNYVNQQSFGLNNLEFLTQFNGKKFSDLPSYLQRRLEEFEITAYIIAAGTPKVLKFNVFKRINTGGLTLTSQEIRNALNQGKPAQFVKKLAGLRSFKIATTYTIPEDRVLDQEFITRFLAFYLLDIDTYNSDLDSFLNRGMDELNNISNIEKIEKDFEKAMDASILIFGNDAFRKRFSKNDKRKPINKALFEVWSVVLSKLNTDEITILINNKDDLMDKFINLLSSDENFNMSITSATGDKTRIKKRFNEINSIVQTTIKSAK
jgi:hypothetical protein